MSTFYSYDRGDVRPLPVRISTSYMSVMGSRDFIPIDRTARITNLFLTTGNGSTIAAEGNSVRPSTFSNGAMGSVGAICNRSGAPSVCVVGCRNNNFIVMNTAGGCCPVLTCSSAGSVGVRGTGRDNFSV